MDLHLKDKVVIVTGGAGGIGSGISRVFASEGAHVIVTYLHNAEPARQHALALAEEFGIKASALQCDSADEDAVSALFDYATVEFGPVDVLVNNAGNTNVTIPFIDIDLQSWNEQIHDNLTGHFVMSREFARRAMAEQRPGWIVNVLSKASVSSVTYGRATYVANKAGEMGLTRAMAVDLTRHNIRVNGVMPGFVMNRKISREREHDPAAFQRRVDRSPLGRIGEPEEIGRMVAFLASDQCGLAVGSCVDVTGGLLLGY